MKRYSFLQAYGLSFFSRDLYQDVGRNWKGTGLGYLFCLIALSWIPAIIQANVAFGRFVRDEAPAFFHDFPRIEIKHGVVSTEVQTPYALKDEHGKTWLMIDLTGKYNSLDEAGSQVLLTKNKLHMRQSNQEVRIYDLSQIDDFWLDKGRIQEWLVIIKRIFFVLGWPMCVFFSFCFRAVQNLIYAGLSVLLGRELGANLPFPGYMRLAAVAVSPVILVDTVIDAAGLHIPFIGLALFLGTLLLLFFAVKANAVPKQPAPTAPMQPAG